VRSQISRKHGGLTKEKEKHESNSDRETGRVSKITIDSLHFRWGCTREEMRGDKVNKGMLVLQKNTLFLTQNTFTA
jgi:hypothetical protein